MTLETDLLDRIHAINGTLSTVNAYRYYYQLHSDPARYPGVVPLLGPTTRDNQQTGQARALLRHTIFVELVGKNWLEGDVGISAQKAIESAMSEIRTAYMQATRAELSNLPLYPVSQMLYQSDTGVQFINNLSVVRYTLQLSTWQSITV